MPQIIAKFIIQPDPLALEDDFAAIDPTDRSCFGGPDFLLRFTLQVSSC